MKCSKLYQKKVQKNVPSSKKIKFIYLTIGQKYTHLFVIIFDFKNSACTKNRLDTVKQGRNQAQPGNGLPLSDDAPGPHRPPLRGGQKRLALKRR